MFEKSEQCFLTLFIKEGVLLELQLYEWWLKDLSQITASLEPELFVIQFKKR